MSNWKHFEGIVRAEIDKVCKEAEVSEQFDLNWIEQDRDHHSSNRPDFIVKLGDLYLVIDAKCWKNFNLDNPLDTKSNKKWFRWSAKNVLKTFWYAYYFELLLNNVKADHLDLRFKTLPIKGVEEKLEKPITAYLSGDHNSAYIAFDFEYEHPKDGLMPIKLSELHSIVVPILVVRDDTNLTEASNGKDAIIDLATLQFPRNELIVNTLDPGIAPMVPKTIFVTKIGKLKEVIDIITSHKICSKHMEYLGTPLSELEKATVDFKLPQNAGFILNFFEKTNTTFTIGKELATYFSRCPKCKQRASDFNRVTGWCPVYREPLINDKCLTGPGRSMCCCPNNDFNIDDEVYLCPDCQIFFNPDGDYVEWNDFMDDPSKLITMHSKTEEGG